MSKYVLIFCLLCLFLIIPSIKCTMEVLPFGLTSLCHAEMVGYWPFNKDDVAGGKVIDRSGKGHGGVISGAVQETGKKGEALRFDGSNSYVSIDGLIVKSSQLSASLWIKKDALSEVHRLIYFDGLLQFGFYHTSIFVHTQTLNGEDPNLPYESIGIVAGQWHHLVVTWDTAAPSDNVKVYVDGDLKLKGTLVKSKGGKIGIAGLTIGNDKSSSGHGFDGLIDEVAVYDTALTDEEIKNLYKGEVKP